MGFWIPLTLSGSCSQSHGRRECIHAGSGVPSMARNAARFTNSFRKPLRFLIIERFYCGGRWGSDRTTYEINTINFCRIKNLRFSKNIHKASGVMSQGWRMRAYRDVLAASVRLWMILGKRGGFKNEAVSKTPIAGVAYGSGRTTIFAESKVSNTPLRGSLGLRPHYLGVWLKILCGSD